MFVIIAFDGASLAPPGPVPPGACFSFRSGCVPLVSSCFPSWDGMTLLLFIPRKIQLKLMTYFPLMARFGDIASSHQKTQIPFSVGLLRPSPWLGRWQLGQHFYKMQDLFLLRQKERRQKKTINPIAGKAEASQEFPCWMVGWKRWLFPSSPASHGVKLARFKNGSDRVDRLLFIPVVNSLKFITRTKHEKIFQDC